ncbi:trimethylamine---corrinoid protein Co-methyltransferase [Candidatus Hakubella thermalkaliphila]|uniref:Trimethylamine---corrinoid protein Co-methyltransferase n=1 Tax=Candidatus Hakubella thermalkaliphila TaxID=2754717 RepID=A0A6V8PIA3_9ACTN|nr:trimethylamine---corrinoid protein Co-methyltransferase [Candidatus Hakubella thermalkaliphila]
MRINYQVNQTVFFKVLSEDQIEEIYLGALEVLERTGVKIYQERAVKLLKEAGCDVTEGNRVRIPTSLVQQALATAPSRIGIANRRGERVMMLEDGKVYYGPGPTCPNILDPYTKERRKFLKNDARNTARLCDALPNIDFVMSLGSISDVPQALAEVARWLKLPMWSTGGCTDSKLLDEQAALEAALNLLLAGLSGANLIHDVGFMESAMTGSQELLVLSDEIIGMVRRIVQGIRVDEETLALDIIHKVGPGGNFLGEDHTLRHFRKEAWYPRLLDRRMYLDWVGGGSLTLAQRVNKKTREVLESHQPVPLPQDVLEGIDEILRRADERAAEIEAQKV